MNITFLVGNGFDINLGLKTRYTDFYPVYLNKGHDDILSKSIANNYSNWADLEVALGKVLKDVTPGQINEFLDSKGTLEGDLAEYLRLEKCRLAPNCIDPKAFQNNISNFYKDFTSKDQADFKTWLSSIRTSISYQFISFNYTDSLDDIVSLAKIDPSFSGHLSGNTKYSHSIGSVHHVHGTLDKDLILGVNDAQQIQNPLLQKDARLASYIIKGEVNEALGEQRTETAKRIIDESDYIGVYGMSIGDTDMMWWYYLLAWLEKKDSRRLVLYIYTNLNDNPSGQEKLRHINTWKNIFLSQSGANEDISQKVRNRIIIVIQSKIFTFSNIGIAEHPPKELPTLA